MAQLESDPGPNEREEIERLLAQIETALSLLEPGDAVGHPHAKERALEIARRDPLVGLSNRAVVALIRNVLDELGDTCPECAREQSGQLAS
ncbi:MULTISPECIES: hypothetical protein [unclassified Bradyrhizobium]|uniref:hypothetical protein n=1 Tax=unclassified Bradyrhizobium TaxID=2631580 RepID=UPI001BAE2565|nr:MULTISPECIES: hypothetical protein [unclassified Bradyrhizobium]MBR1208808.1 hypothetical protein [Bradyrhizobium sp. AUGA SZCCT0124]MBR1317116.1 hypothetical protein [Bradyrhizobium sp. AUGA SZCCT0051]MBR1345410.1 hypothetical protein [Bradyrhizobium sp. AUGA SZCCT0105]MBR1360218.1 hypothetical protein [Bradyrhizobium sp. AUGA SZCCT0045]